MVGFVLTVGKGKSSDLVVKARHSLLLGKPCWAPLPQANHVALPPPPPSRAGHLPLGMSPAPPRPAPCSAPHGGQRLARPVDGHHPLHDARRRHEIKVEAWDSGGRAPVGARNHRRGCEHHGSCRPQPKGGLHRAGQLQPSPAQPRQHAAPAGPAPADHPPTEAIHEFCSPSSSAKKIITLRVGIMRRGCGARPSSPGHGLHAPQGRGMPAAAPGGWGLTERRVCRRLAGTPRTALPSRQRKPAASPHARPLTSPAG